MNSKKILLGADKTLIVNENAEIFFSDHETTINDDFGNENFSPEIDRGALRKILLESLRPETVVWDRQFIAMEKQNEGWLLHFKNKPSAYADIVIGSDGANSKIRPYITDINAIYSGITMLEGTIYEPKKTTPKIHSLLNGGKIMAFGNAQNILMKNITEQPLPCSAKSGDFAELGTSNLSFFTFYTVTLHPTS